MNLSDIHRCRSAVDADKALRISGGNYNTKYNRLSPAAVRRLKHHASDKTAKEWAEELNSSANTVRHRAKALGVTLKPFIRH